jgi:hypothetical protein
MPKANKAQPKKQASKDSFVETAKRLGCDPDMTAFRAKMKKIAKAKSRTAKNA